MIRICAVDARDEKIAALLRYLQLDTLRNDEPFDAPGSYWWIAYEGELPVAFAGLILSTSWFDCGYLCRSGVIKSHRGKGLQKRLIRVRERKARSLGWNWLITDTASWNAASANSLISCGYKLFVPTKPWGIAGAVYWRKKLTNEVQSNEPAAIL